MAKYVRIIGETQYRPQSTDVRGQSPPVLERIEPLLVGPVRAGTRVEPADKGFAEEGQEVFV